MKRMQAEVQVKEILHAGAELTDRALERLLPSEDQVPSSIHRAMRHSTFAGGKRLRPILAMEAARMIYFRKAGQRRVAGRAWRSWARRSRCCTPIR